jgi:hypothetical protein
VDDLTAPRIASSRTRLAACIVALAAACAKYSGPPDPAFAKARDLYQQLYTTELDEAYFHPRMNEVVSLLQSVHKRSVDAPSAQALLHAVEHGREELAKAHAEREKLRQAAAELVATRTNIDPTRVLEQPDAGPAQDPYGPGASIAQINRDTGGCLVSSEPYRETGTNHTGTVYRMAPNPVCRDKLPGFVGQVVMVSDGKMYRRLLESEVPRPAPAAAAGAPDGGAGTAGTRDGGSPPARQAAASDGAPDSLHAARSSGVAAATARGAADGGSGD